MADTASSSPVILFDGVCNLCNGFVQFIIKRDKQATFRFASLQSHFGQQTLKQYSLPTNEFNSFILLQNGKVYTKSTGALRVVKQLSGLWPALYIFILVPPFIRNGIYNWVARNRYTWFGKQESCWLPTYPQFTVTFYCLMSSISRRMIFRNRFSLRR